MLDLLTKAAFFLTCLPVLGQQLPEPFRVCFPLPPEFGETVVDPLSVGF